MILACTIPLIDEFGSRRFVLYRVFHSNAASQFLMAVAEN
jgi:hypothetical protein